MFNLSFYKKKLKKILLPINRIIESFFTELDRSKSQLTRQTPIKKKMIQLDSWIESFFNKFKNLKKFNQNKKKFYYLNNKIAISMAFVILLFFCYFLIPAFYKENKIKTSLVNQISNRYDIKIKFNEKVKYGLFPKPFFYTKNLNINYNEKVIANSKYVKFYISFRNFFISENISLKNVVFQTTEFNIFLDIANVWGVDYDSSLDTADNIKSSIGIGFDWFTVVGPMSFSLSQPLTKSETDVEETFRFNLGTTF